LRSHATAQIAATAVTAVDPDAVPDAAPGRYVLVR